MNVRTSPVLFAPALLAVRREHHAYAALIVVSSLVSVMYWRDAHNETLLCVDRLLVLARGSYALALVLRTKSALAASLGIATLVVYAAKCVAYEREKRERRERRAAREHGASSRLHSAFHGLAVLTEIAALRYS